jgi:NADH:ubiquinone oxidoreductase subunit 6 (subunit J)
MSQYDKIMLGFLGAGLAFLVAAPFLALIEPLAGFLAVVVFFVLLLGASGAKDAGEENEAKRKASWGGR